MKVTEILITGFDGDDCVFAVNLTSDAATTNSTSTGQNGETVVNETRRHQSSDALEAILEILERLPKVPSTIHQKQGQR